MDLVLWLALLALFGGVTALASWRAARPASHKPRLAPWRLLMILAGAGAIFILVHLLNMAGFATGQSAPAP
jgi:hypothetical protein